jgi:hypothetical protein
MAQTDVEVSIMSVPNGASSWKLLSCKTEHSAIYLQEPMLVKYSRDLVPNIFISYPTRSAIECNIPLQ